MEPSETVAHLFRTGRIARAAQRWQLERMCSWMGMSERQIIREYGRPDLPPEPESIVYLLGGSVPPVDGEPVKIGYTRNIRQRLETLQMGCPFKLWLVAYLEGGKELEAEIHAELDEHRIREDWFLMCDAVRVAFAPRIDQQARAAA